MGARSFIVDISATLPEQRDNFLNRPNVIGHACLPGRALLGSVRLQVAVVREPDECFQRDDPHKLRIDQVVGQCS